MKIYKEGFYAVDSQPIVVVQGNELSVNYSATVEIFNTLTELDASYPPVDLTTSSPLTPEVLI